MIFVAGPAAENQALFRSNNSVSTVSMQMIEPRN